MRKQNLDIFISYRRNSTADKAEHLLSLLGTAGYQGMVSFDKDNFKGRFDIQIINRVDSCTDFIIILDEDTFSYLKPDNPDNAVMNKIAECSPEELIVLEKELVRVDYVRIELARAIRHKKNIIPIVPVNSPSFNFGQLLLPDDISALTRYQAVTYNANDSSSLFQDILPKIVKKLETKPNESHDKNWSSSRRSPKWWILLGAFLAALLIAAVVQDSVRFLQCRTASDMKAYLDSGLSLRLFGNIVGSRLKEIDGLQKEAQSFKGFSSVSFSADITLDQAHAIKKIVSKMLFVPGGCFVMGSDDDVVTRKERPAHEEHVGDYYIGKYEVSEDEWAPFMGGKKPRTDYPATDLTWHDAMEFCNRLSSASGVIFRLPTEKEWEYAAGYGQDYIYAGGSDPDKVAWYSERTNAGNEPHVRNDRKGGLECNELELYDMSGNVSEWCFDSFYIYGQEPDDEDNKIVKGGSVADPATRIRITYRDSMGAETSSKYVGIRIAASI